jgi:hypothetical protein
MALLTLYVKYVTDKKSSPLKDFNYAPRDVLTICIFGETFLAAKIERIGMLFAVLVHSPKEK